MRTKFHLHLCYRSEEVILNCLRLLFVDDRHGNDAYQVSPPCVLTEQVTGVKK